MSPLFVVGQVFDGLLSLAFLGSAFLVWNRSRAAAILGACAGAAQLFVLLVFVVMDVALRSSASSAAMRIVNVIVSGFGNLVFYGCLTAMVLVLARANEARR
jgi:hypothetical protein